MSHHPYDTAGHLPGDMSPAWAIDRVEHVAGGFPYDSEERRALDWMIEVARAAAHPAEGAPPPCPGGCGCRWRMDAERSECACGGPCCMPEDEHGVQVHPAWGERPDPDDDDQSAAAPGQGRERELAAWLDDATRIRAATPGRPEDGPYPATVGEVADEVVAWITAQEVTWSAPGLAREVRDRLRALADGDQEGQR